MNAFTTQGKIRLVPSATVFLFGATHKTTSTITTTTSTATATSTIEENLQRRQKLSLHKALIHHDHDSPARGGGNHFGYFIYHRCDSVQEEHK